MDPRGVLKNSYLFRGVNEEDLEALMALAERKTLLQGELAYAAGSDADAMFLVEMGTVDITVTGKEIPIITAGIGQSFGELPFFRPAKRSVSALAREPTRLLRIPFDRLARLLGERPALALAVYKNASGFFAKHLELMSFEVDYRYL